MQQAVSDEQPISGNNTPINNPIIGNPMPANVGKFNENKVDQKPLQNLAPSSLNDSSSGNTHEFKNRMSQHAEEASRVTGVPANLMLGQAALESGWGKRELKGTDGTPSNNLFGIKASGNWNGKVVEATTTEYVHGIKQKRIEKFRAYDNYADSFKDFANMMSNNPRYENVMANLDDVNGYAQAMQKAGYATDPNYAIKLASVIQKVSP
jgi:flagellar protein FlgJ